MEFDFDKKIVVEGTMNPKMFEMAKWLDNEMRKLVDEATNHSTKSIFVEKDVENLEILRQLDRYMVGHSGFIAGGCFNNVLNKEKIKDVDIFFENEEEWNEAVKYYNSKTDRYKEGNNQVSETPAEYTFCYENYNNCSYHKKERGNDIEVLITNY